MVCAAIVIGLLMDQLLGEARRYHPLVGFGWCAQKIEQYCNRHASPTRSFSYGLLSTCILILPCTLLTIGLKPMLGIYYIALDVIILYWAIGLKSLIEHTRPINALLEKGDINRSRLALARIVSRDTDRLNETQVATATIETTLENGCDALFGVLFWYLLGGAPMVIVYRLINTLDAMWGYRTNRYEWFGKPVARFDDILNYVPARLTAIGYALCGNSTQAILCWRKQAGLLNSPNAGPVMSSGAGSLELKLGGDSFYHQKLVRKPHFGGPHTPKPSDIERAIKIVISTTLLWVVIIGVSTLILQ